MFPGENFQQNERKLRYSDPIRGQKGADNLAHKIHVSHTFESAHNMPVNQISGSGVKNYMRKWPKTSKIPNFD